MSRSNGVRNSTKKAIGAFKDKIQNNVSSLRERNKFKELFRYIRKEAATTNPRQNILELNTLLDNILPEYNEHLRNKKKNIVIFDENDQHQTIPCKILGRTIKVKFNGKNGTFDDLGTLYRKEDCTLTMPRNNFRIFTFYLSLHKAKLEFPEYEMEVGPMHPKGHISVDIRDLVLCVKVSMSLKGDNNQVLDRLEVTRADLVKCGKYNIRVSGFGKFGGNRMARFLIKMILKNYRKQNRAHFEEKCKEFIRALIVKHLT